MLEPSGGSWGRIPLTKEFNQQLRELTSKFGFMLIYDEVITGFRSSTGGYQKLTGIKPDISVLGKIISGGLPGGAVVGLNGIMELFDIKVMLTMIDTKEFIILGLLMPIRFPVQLEL